MPSEHGEHLMTQKSFVVNLVLSFEPNQTMVYLSLKLIWFPSHEYDVKLVFKQIAKVSRKITEEKWIFVGRGWGVRFAYC